MKSLLTIAIPTRNRCKYLIETVDSILEQPLFDNIEIIICNNDSNDNTSLEMTKYNKYKNILYVENESLLSIDDNMIKVAGLVQTEYFLWLGDDDFIIANGLIRIINYIKKFKYDFILLNAMKVSENLNEKIKQTINIGKDIEYNSSKEFFIKHCFHMPFGTLIVKKELFDLVINENSRFNGTSHAYSGLVFDYLSKINQLKNEVHILVISKEFIQLRQIEKSWKSNATKIFFQEIPQWFFLMDDYYKSEVSQILQNYINDQFQIKNLMMHRIKSQLSLKNYGEYTKLASNLQKIKFIIVCFIPLFRKIKIT